MEDNSKDENQQEDKTRILDLENISINTMKDDLQKNKEKENKKGTWFNFLLNKKAESTPDQSTQTENQQDGAGLEPSQPIPTETSQEPLESFDQLSEPEPSPELNLEEEESKKPEENIEENMSIESQNVNDVVKEIPNLSEIKKMSIERQLMGDNDPDKDEEMKEEESPEMNDKTAVPLDSEALLEKELEEFKEKDKPVTQNAAPANLPIIEGQAEQDANSDKDQTYQEFEKKFENEKGDEDESRQAREEFIEKSEKLGGVEKASVPQSAINDSLLQKPVGKIGKIKSPSEEIKESEVEQEQENPFTARLEKRPGDSQLLQAVESALNYSAPTEFAQERSEDRPMIEEEGGIVDLREKGIPKALPKKSSKLIWIGGGVGAFIIIGIVLIVALSGSSNNQAQKSSNQNSNSAAAQDNKSTGTITAQKTPEKSLVAKKFLASSKEIPVQSVGDVYKQVELLKKGGISKITQVVFTKQNSSSISFQDLMDALSINIPAKILSNPSSEPALYFLDFFGNNTVSGIVIPVSDNDQAAMAKMKEWEPNMIMNVSKLWKGMVIDNPNAYFSDSKMFPNARFALIDKASGLSLDYMYYNGYILIACGKNSLTALKNNFIAEKSASGIQVEGSSSSSLQKNPSSSSPNNSGGGYVENSNPDTSSAPKQDYLSGAGNSDASSSSSSSSSDYIGGADTGTSSTSAKNAGSTTNKGDSTSNSPYANLEQ